MEIRQVLTISTNKLAKLLRSKFYWAFFLGGLLILLFILIPILAAEEFRAGGPMVLMLLTSFTQTYTIFGVLASVTIGSIVLVQDIRDGTIFPYLAKPISRTDFILGKIIGAFWLIVIFWIFEVIYFLIFMFAATDYGITINVIMAFIYDLLLYFLIISVTAFLSIFMHPIWSSSIVMASFILPGIAKLMINTEWGFWTLLARVVYYITPEYNILSNWGNIARQSMIGGVSEFQKLAYFVTFLLLVLLPTFYIFTRRNLTPKD